MAFLPNSMGFTLNEPASIFGSARAVKSLFHLGGFARLIPPKQRRICEIDDFGAEDRRLTTDDGGQTPEDIAATAS